MQGTLPSGDADYLGKTIQNRNKQKQIVLLVKNPGLCFHTTALRLCNIIYIICYGIQFRHLAWIAWNQHFISDPRSNNGDIGNQF